MQRHEEETAPFDVMSPPRQPRAVGTQARPERTTAEPAPFGVEGRHTGGVTVLRATGRLVAGAGAAHPVWQAAREWRGASRVVVELDAVTTLDAGGVGALLRLRQSAARHDVPVVIATVAPRARRVLQLAHLDGVFGLPADVPPTGADVGGPSLGRCA